MVLLSPFATIVAFALDLGISDVCNGWPSLDAYLLHHVGHFGLGLVFGLAPQSRIVASIFFSGWLVKEVFGDFSGCSQLRVLFDGALDIAIGAAGFWVARLLVRKWMARSSGKSCQLISEKFR